MKEVICINSIFPRDYLEFYQKHNVQIPKKDQIYTIREVVKPSLGGEAGILLEEIKNPLVPVKHHILTSAMMEPSWKISRFAKLDGSSISREEVREMIKEQSKTLVK